ncbi:hypothetical protein BD410DRAFT_707680, partial [Rickenella mellea]
QVENCLFKLPRHYFEQSEAFEGMFALPPTDIQEGTSNENPIRLEGTKSWDFAAFLKVIYDRENGGVRDLDSITLQELLAALELAHKWGFKKVLQRAIKATEEFSMDEVERIRITHKYGINEWAGPTYEKLLLRENPLTADEMGSLGLEFSSKMWAARERL